MLQKDDEFFMSLALSEAEKAFSLGEIPVGAVIVCNKEVVATGRNTRETEQNALGHAEINAIRQACAVKKTWRLSDCCIYVTLEPCLMCAGAIVNARMERVVFGASDTRQGGFGGLADLSKIQYYSEPKLKKNVLGEQCQQILNRFFDKIR